MKARQCTCRLNKRVLCIRGLNAPTCDFFQVYRIYKIAKALFQLETNPSIKDMEKKMTSLSNTVFNLILLAVTGSNPDRAIIVSLAFTLISLLRQMNQEQITFKQIAGPLKDFNENRLNTFECALLWTKVCEDFLDDDIKLNWVQIFRDQEPLMPIFDDEEAVRVLCKEEEDGLKGNLDRVKDWFIESVHKSWAQEHPDSSSDLLYLAAMDAGDINLFG